MRSDHDDDQDRPKAAAELRRRAEEQMEEGRSLPRPLPTTEEKERLFHELQVHQIELEMQNAELTRARDKIEELLERYTDLYDFAPVCYLSLDRDGTILALNLTGANLFGTVRSGLVGRRFWQFVAAADRPAFAAFFEKTLASPDKVTCELALLKEGGAPLFAQIEALAAPSGEECRLALIDITERRRVGQEGVRSQKLESLGILAGGIAHDFNNILTTILGNIAMARLRWQDQESATKHLADAELAVDRAKGLTQQLLTFARGGTPIKKTFRIDGPIREAVGFALQGSSVKSRFLLADDLWPVDGDEGQLSQVIHNLILNAVQAMPAGGTITIAAQNGVAGPEGERLVKIAVTDTGPGISANLLAKIFDPYFTTKEQGSGLGLTVSYSIVKKHGGELSVESTPGSGTTFHISLPAGEEIPFASAPAASTLARGQGRILIMDDEVLIREVATAMLEELGYRVECTGNGAEAVELYLLRKSEGNPFAAVILDLTVPGGMGGRETVVRLHQFDPQVRAIVSSGYADDPVMAEFRSYGFSGVLSKPYRPQELVKAVQKVLTSSA